MNHDLINRITSVKHNLDLQIEDIAFRKESVEVEMYYDTSDIHNAILGSRIFYPPFEDDFAKRKFDDKRTLVHSLIASGWLGKIRLLPPHQAEFLTRLKFYFGVDIATDPKGDARNFLRDIGLENVNPFIDAASEGFKKEKLLEFVKEQAGFAEKLFKAIQCLVPWHRRLARWESQKILEFETLKPRYDELIQTEDFGRLKREFDRRRSSTPANNFADAVAAAILIQRVKDFNQGDRSSLPRFYVPTELFREVFADAGVTSHLTYMGPSGEESSVLCNSDYYIYKAAFIPRPERAADIDPRTLESTEDYLRDLSSKVTAVLDLQETLTPEALNEIKDLAGRPLSEIIKDLQQFSFLENVWLNFEAPQEMDQALSELVEASRDFASSDAFQQGVAKAIKVTEAKLNESVEEFKWISSVWLRVERAAVELRSRVREGSSSSDEFFRDLGLFRYGFPESTHENIRDILQEIISGEEAEKAARISVISASYRGRRNPVEEVERLIIASAIMLATRMYHELYLLLNKVKPLPHRSLKIVFTEALFRLRPKRRKDKRDRRLELIIELEEEYKKTDQQSERADLAVGIGFLYFRQWRSLGGNATWRPHLDTQGYVSRNTGERFINYAINYAYQAYNLFDEDQMMKKVYALNQYLYYMVESGNSQHLNAMDDAASELSKYRVESDLWQFRFDDTLSRYFHLLAVRAGSKEDWERLIKKAEMLNEDSVKDSHGDEDVRQHAIQLMITISKGYRGSEAV